MTWQALFNDALDRLGKERRMDVERIICKIRSMPRASVLAHLDDAADALEADAFADAVSRLAAHEPIQYILGVAPFWDFDVKVTPAVLIPRFDTETLVERALVSSAALKKPKVLDICTGSGIVAIALARQLSDAQVSAGDISPEALAIAKENGSRLAPSIDWQQGDLFVPWPGEKFDLITANPPYIVPSELDDMAPEVVEYEPHLALLGGIDGLDFYRRIIKEAILYLNDQGVLLLEIGVEQGMAVANLLRENGYSDIKITKDPQGLDRVVEGRKGYVDDLAK